MIAAAPIARYHAGEERGSKARYLKNKLQTNPQKGKPAPSDLTNIDLFLEE
jgi:hypothetical protein